MNTIPSLDKDALLLRRIGYGNSITELLELNSVGYSSYLEKQLHPDFESEESIINLYPVFAKNVKKLSKLLVKKEKLKEHIKSYTKAVYSKKYFSNSQLEEKMIEFWTDHFNITGNFGKDGILKIIDDKEVVRKNALGNFKDLLSASSKSPAMIKYLNNDKNISGQANENYAREIMELHTLGVEGGYSEDDIKEAARCFTGYNYKKPTKKNRKQPVSFHFNDKLHDKNPKSFIGYNVNHGQDVVDVLSEMPQTAYFVCEKLCKFFVSPSPSSELIEILATTFQESKGDIRDTLRVMFHSQEFFDSSYQIYKRPLDFCLGIARTFKCNPSNELNDFLAKSIKNMGQALFAWPTPDGYSNEKQSWLDTTSTTSRWNFTFKFIRNLKNFTNLKITDYIPINVSSEQQLEIMCDLLLPNQKIADEDKYRLLTSLQNEKNAVKKLEITSCLILNSHYYQFT